MAQIKHASSAPFRVRGTLPTLTKWSLFGYDTREEAESLIAAMTRDDWTVESKGVNSPVTKDWHREHTAADTRFDFHRFAMLSDEEAEREIESMRPKYSTIKE